MAGARFLLTQGPMVREQPPRTPGDRPVRSARALELPVGVAAWTGWLLLGGNNRELGRGCVAFDDVQECEAAVAALVEAADSLRTVITADLDVSSWRWRAELRGTAVAVGGRLYQRRRECAYALNQFLVALPAAELPSAPPRVLSLSWAEWSRPGEDARRRSAGTTAGTTGGTSGGADPVMRQVAR